MAKYDPTTNGRTSQQKPGNEALREEWEIAARMNAEHSGPGEWVPRRTVYVDDAISPRRDGNLDHDRVAEYATNFAKLPPILVQKDTFTLIDGKHRLHAAFEAAASTVHILIEEMDIPDSELWIEAYRANKSHGRALTTAERVAFTRKLLKAFPKWSDAKICDEAGVSRMTVIKYRPAPRDPNAPIEREGKDGKVYERAPQQVVQIRQPEAIPESTDGEAGLSLGPDSPEQEVDARVTASTRAPSVERADPGAETDTVIGSDEWRRERGILSGAELERIRNGGTAVATYAGHCATCTCEVSE